MTDVGQPIAEGSAANRVFETLTQRILSLELTPGTLISEAQIAAELSVSRQPVREAFNRLGTLNLVQIRPRRGTRVKRFSSAAITEDRFVTLAVELELVRRASEVWDESRSDAFETVIDAQISAANTKAHLDFIKEDARFHLLIADAAKCSFAAKIIAEKRTLIGRISRLGQLTQHDMNREIKEHRDILAYLQNGDASAASAAIRAHHDQFSPVVEFVRSKHPTYFC